MVDLTTMPEQELLARVMWGEARGESQRGQQAIANVVMNRSYKPRWWGTDVRSVILKPSQFSCLNASDPNRPKLLSVTQDDQQYAVCYNLADHAISGTLPDVTGGADSYQVVGANAYWSRNLLPTVTIGKHEFFKTV